MFYDTSYGGTTSQELHVGPDEPMNQVLDPQSNADVTRGSMLQDLADNLGYYVEIDFLIGTQNIVTRGGILYAVGNNYVTLYQDLEDRYVVCDLYSIKFVTFYNTRSTPRGRGTINAPAGNAGSRSM